MTLTIHTFLIVCPLLFLAGLVAATAADSRNDCIATTAVLLAAAGAVLTALGLIPMLSGTGERLGMEQMVL